MADAAKDQVTEKAATGSVNLADLASKAEDQGQIMEVRHPGTGEVLRFDDGRPYTITLVGKESDRFIELQRKIQDRRAQAMMRSRQPLLAIMSEKDEIDLLVNSTLSWDVMFGDNGSSKPSADNYRKAYSSTRWLRRQVDEFIGNASNFFKAT
jgi:hypothetical protein